jgi:sugar (pentulose or hexulose) kinase
MMKEPLVIGIDSSTQSTKAIAWNKRGEIVAEGRADIPMQNPEYGYYEQQPEDWWLSCLAAVKGCVAQIDSSDVVGLSISNQRETIGFMDAVGQPTHPAIVWLDERAHHEVREFSESFGAQKIHQITGRPPDLTPSLYTMRWMQKHRPTVYKKTKYFVDVQSYLVRELCGGNFRTGTLSADSLGIYDMEAGRWSVPLLKALDLTDSHLSELHKPGALLGSISEEAANATGLQKGLAVYAGGGDGQLAGLGTNCTMPDRSYINLGTAVVSGIWSPTYRYSKTWRTLLAGQGEGFILETCLRTGVLLINWFVDHFVTKGEKSKKENLEYLEKLAEKIPIGSDGLLLQPYFSGVMDPHWNIDARGIYIGLNVNHTTGHLYRAIIEGITLDQVMRTQSQEMSSGQKISHYIAIGGGANSRLWCQILADASGKPVYVSSTVEASALGAGMIAAYGAGWFSSIKKAANAMSGQSEAIYPNEKNHVAYQELLEIYKDLYPATIKIGQRLVAFSNKQREQNNSV